MKKTILFLFTLMLSVSAYADSWSAWRTLTQSSGVTLDYRYKHRSEVTEVQWRAINHNHASVYAAVRDKEYRLAGGGSTSPSDEGSNVRGNSTYTFQPDFVRGHVTAVSAYLVVRDDY